MRRTQTSILALALVTICFAAHGLAAPEQQKASASESEVTRLSQRVEALEAQANTLREKYEQSAGFRDTEYILRVQRLYESYYEKALNTQIYTIWGIGLFLTVVLALAGRFGFGLFDRQIEYTIKAVATELRSSFEQKLQIELRALEKRNEEQVSRAVEELTKHVNRAVEDVRIETEAQLRYDEGLIFAALNQYEDSIASFRRALSLYVNNRDRQIIKKKQAGLMIVSLLKSIRHKAPEIFKENAEKELASDLCKGLSEEIALARAESPGLAEALGGK